MVKLSCWVKAGKVFGSLALKKAIKEITWWYQQLQKLRLRAVIAGMKASQSRERFWIGAALLALFIGFSQHAGNIIDVANAVSVAYTGVNLAGAEFGESSLPGTYNINYEYPTHGEVDYFVGKGMTIFRLPFRWERLQHQQFGNFDPDELARIDDFVHYATSKGALVILDPHNYGRYYGEVIGQNVPVTAFVDFWSKLANIYKSNTKVIFGLMNEPNTMPTELWRDDANAAIQAIRKSGAPNLILVPGNSWTSAQNWNKSWYGTSNAKVMLEITDPGNNYAFEVHQYLDSNFSGTSDQCVSNTIGSENLVDFTAWLEQNGKRGFLGEFAGGRNNTCYAALDDMLSYIDKHANVWLGWTYWAAGPWWGDYIFTLEPVSGADRPQFVPLSKHISSVPSPTPTTTPSPTPPPKASLQAEAIIQSDWKTGFCVNFRVTNKGNTSTRNWQLQFQMSQAQINQNWNFSFTKQGLRYVVTPPEWARVIQPNQTQASLGFCADKQGSNYKPTQVSATSL